MEPETLAEIRRLQGAAAVGGECEREIKERTSRTAPAEVIDGDGLVDDGEGVLRPSVSSNLPGVCNHFRLRIPDVGQQHAGRQPSPGGHEPDQIFLAWLCSLPHSFPFTFFHLAASLPPFPLSPPRRSGEERLRSILACLSSLTFIRGGSGETGGRMSRGGSEPFCLSFHLPPSSESTAASCEMHQQPCRLWQTC